jgi:hypothetical protein
LVSDDPPDQPSRESHRIIRRQPTGPIPTGREGAQPPAQEPQTGIIRRAPTGPIPTAPDDSPPQAGGAPSTAYIPRPVQDDAPTGLIRRATPVQVPARGVPEQVPVAKTAVAAAAVSIVSGWATSVIATDLITGWWGSDLLFCVALGFLTAVFGVATIGGVVLLLLRRRLGIYLTIAGAVVTLLVFAGLFVAGAKFAWVVYAVPILPLASIVLVLLPETRRWTKRA